MGYLEGDELKDGYRFVGAHIVEQLLDQGCAVRGVVHTKSNADDISKLFPVQKLEGRLEMKVVADYEGIQQQLFDGIGVVIHATPPPNLAPTDGRQIESTPHVTTQLLDAVAHLPLTLIYIALDREEGRKDVLRETIEAYVAAHANLAVIIHFIHAPRVLGPFLNPEHETLNPSNQMMWNVIINGSGGESKGGQFVDVRDLARECARCALGVSDGHVEPAEFKWNDIAAIVRARFPNEASRVGPEWLSTSVTTVNVNSKLGTTVGDAFAQFFDAEARAMKHQGGVCACTGGQRNSKCSVFCP